MTDISPLSREEKQLRKLLGQSIQTEPPQSRIEFLLQEIIDGGGVGGGSYKIKDQYATLADLEAAHPTGADGDAYLVGDPTHIYVWLDDQQAYGDGGLFAAVPGLDGVGITSIEKTATAGLVDTYTITYTDGDTDTFEVTNGAQGAPGADGADGVGITDIQKTSTVGLVDTYTITLTDGSTYDFTVTNGSGGSGVPEGGTTGQVLAKKSNADGDVEWVNQSGGSDVSSEIASLSASASEAASEISSLSTENSTQESEIGSLTAVDSAHTSELGSLSQSMSELASAASSTSTAQSEMDSTQNGSISSLASENSTQTSEIASLSTENSTQTSELDSLSAAASEMDSELDVIGSEVADKQDALVEGPGIDIDAQTNEIKSKMVLFTGSHDAWDALTTAQKKTYTHAAFTDDEGTGLVDLVPTEDSQNLVTSGGVYHNSAYSEDEIETSITYEGKKVFKRTFKGYSTSYVTYTSLRQFVVQLIDSNIDAVLSADGAIEYNQNNYRYQIPSINFKASGDMAHTCHIRQHITGGSVALIVEAPEADALPRIDYFVTLTYTKIA